jgi:hypothetical protein
MPRSLSGHCRPTASRWRSTFHHRLARCVSTSTVPRRHPVYSSVRSHHPTTMEAMRSQFWCPPRTGRFVENLTSAELPLGARGSASASWLARGATTGHHALMMRSAVGLLAITVSLTACASSESADDAVDLAPARSTNPSSPVTSSADSSATSNPATTVIPLRPDDCSPAPSVEVRGDTGAVVADLVYFGESSPTCGYNSDGVAMFDSSIRPDSVLVASDGRIDVVVSEPGDVRVDIRELHPNAGIGAIELGGEPLVSTDGTYPLALPGSRLLPRHDRLQHGHT